MTLPPEATAELKRIRLKHRARELVAEALLATLIYSLQNPGIGDQGSDEVSLDRYLAGR